MMEVLSGLQESSSRQSSNDDATRKEDSMLGKYRLALGYLQVEVLWEGCGQMPRRS